MLRYFFSVLLGLGIGASLTWWLKPAGSVEQMALSDEKAVVEPEETASSEPVSEGNPPTDAEVPPLQELEQTIKTLAAVPAVSSGTVGFYLAASDAPEVALVEHHAKQSFITASTMKTITTGAALEILGPDYQFETPLLYDEGRGELIVKGGGDPSLGRDGWEALFADWLGAVRSTGLAEIKRVIADESSWESQATPDGWVWLDIGNYYAPPMTPLTFHDNEFSVYFTLKGEPGAPAVFSKAEPWPDGLLFTDEVTIGSPGSGDNAYVYGAAGASRYFLRGTLAADAGKEFIRAALPDPALFAAQQLSKHLQKNGVIVREAATTTRRLADDGVVLELSGAKTITTHRSSPLRELLVPINHRSLNLDCENLLRVLGEGKARTGLRRVHQHYADKGLPTAGFEQADGSGLARSNMITPELLARANGAVLAGPQGEVFLASLPVLGARGSTLRSLGGLSSAATIHAKSGTIERVKGYTGQVTAGDGRFYIFAVLINNYDGSYSRDVAPGINAIFEALGKL